MLKQILSTILKRNVWRSVWRICMLILGLKGLRFEITPGVEGSGFSHRLYGYMLYIYTPQLPSLRGARDEIVLSCHVQ